MNDKIASKKRPVPHDGEDGTEAPIDTVALMCIAVVQKSEYDEMAVKVIDPIVVHGGNGQVVKINPFLLVGSAEGTREEAINRLDMVWETYNKRRQEAPQP